MAVIAAVSHKGGTGRSVTTANVAYQLAHSGLNVCVVDLDLASPTFGAIIGLKDIETGVAEPSQPGVPRSVGDLLDDPTEASFVNSALRDVWKSEALRTFKPAGSYMLLPGSRHIGDAYTAPQMSDAMDRLIDGLRERFDVVYLDLRSGASEVLTCFRSADASDAPRRCDMWLLHFRWTKQHLIGLKDVVDMLNDGDDLVDPERQFLVKTAYVDPHKVEPPARQAVIRRHHSELVSALEGMNVGPYRASDKLIGEVPLESMLQWREGIITKADAERGLADIETLEAFRNISDAIRSFNFR